MSPLHLLRRSAAAALICLVTLPAFGESDSLLWKREPEGKWNRSAITSLASLPDWQPAAPDERSWMGGWVARRFDEGTGFFRVARVDGRWWLVDPLGYLFYSVGLTSVRPPTREPAKGIYAERWKDPAAWAADTVAMLRDAGYNNMGRWSDLASLNAVKRPMPYTTSFNFMQGFGKKLGLTSHGYGHARYAHNAIPVFHPDFEAHCNELAEKEIAPLAQDSNVLGHFTDNELPVPRDALSATLAIDPEAMPALRYNWEFAWKWLRERRGAEATAAEVTEEDNLDYLGAVMERYFEVTTAALRRHARHHLNFGPRLHGSGIHADQVIAAAGRHLDVIAINYYNVWGPSKPHLERWRIQAPDTPFLISEFYVKGEDSGMDNGPGAGWIVPTQRDRGLWYQNFTLALLGAPHCVGWQYFKYQDEPGDSNKGILDTTFAPHGDFISLMAPIHANVYSLRTRLTGD